MCVMFIIFLKLVLNSNSVNIDKYNLNKSSSKSSIFKSVKG